jgi:aminoglycoside phosphotransferase (APT) family kinase protein
VPEVTDAETDRGLVDALAQVVSSTLGERDVRVEGLRLLSGGASRETWSFDAVLGTGSDPPRHGLVLQRARGGVSDSMVGPSMRLEDDLLSAASRHGVPVPATVVDTRDAEPLLGTARVSARIAGETLGHRIVRDDRFAAARARLPRQCGQALAAIHSIDTSTLEGLEPVEPLQRLRDGLDLVGEQRPAFEIALRWLAANRPDAPTSSTLVHGDFRLGNLVVDETGLRAVLDWELAHLGDPLEDLGWLCVRSWRFGGDGLVAGVGGVDELLDAYHTAGGTRATPERVRWWIVVGTLTWGLICAFQARRHLEGVVRSVELAAIGRRICEAEYDLLQLLGVPAPGPHQAEDGTDTARGLDSVHGRPTASELLDAVRTHLLERTAPRLEGAGAFHLKVAGNVLATVEREIRLGPGMQEAQRRRLDRLGFVDETALASAIRDGELEDRPEVTAAVRAAVVDRVRVANPKWLQSPDRP